MASIFWKRQTRVSQRSQRVHPLSWREIAQSFIDWRGWRIPSLPSCGWITGNSEVGRTEAGYFRIADHPPPARSYPYQELHTLWEAMPRPKTGDKRAAILRAATKTIAEDGVGASTASIAKAAAVAEGSLFRYFPDKDKLINELYRELKLDMRSAMIAGFPLTGSLRKRVQHIWNAYVTWGMESPAKRRAMMQLTVSERITDQSRKEGQAGFEDATKAMQQFVAQGKLSGLPPAFASDLLLAMAETTMASMVANPAKAEHYRSAGFEAFWSAAAKK